VDFMADPRASLLAYDPGAKIQIRLDATATIHTEDAIVDEAWAGAQRMSRVCYGTMPAPGADIPAGSAFTLPEAEDQSLAAGRVNFAAIRFHVSALELLFLAAEGHRRARFTWMQRAHRRARWLVP